MEVTVLTEQRKNAIELNNKIIFNASMAQDYLWEMCRALKEMKDTKLYKELGYSNFEDYCENEVGMKRRNAYRYIAIVEHINPESVSPVAQIGVKKLALLATLSDEQQKEVTEKVDLENTTYRELKAECDRLKTANKKAESNLKSLQTELDNEKKSNEELLSLRFDKERAEMQLKRIREELETANDKITALENKPAEIEIAVQEDPKAKETIKQLESQLSQNEQTYTNEIKRLRRMYQDKMDDLENQIEQAKNTPAETVTVKDDKGVFKAYYLTALNSFENLLKFVDDCSDRDFCIEKTEKLLEICREKLEEIT